MRIIIGKATANTKPKKICVVSPPLMPPIISSAPIAIHIQKPTLTIALSPLPIFIITYRRCFFQKTLIPIFFF